MPVLDDLRRARRGRRDSGSTGPGTTQTALRQRAVVVRTVDGDTIEVRLSSGAVRDVRLVSDPTRVASTGTGGCCAT